MKTTLLGHASLVVEAGGATVFMDPVFADPFQGTLVTSCPRRSVNVAALPRPDAIILSHAHLDHFHAPSLNALPKDVPVFTPRDANLTRMLVLLGFQDLRPLTHLASATVGDLTLTCTGSAGPAPEMGILFSTPDATLWNQVDTVVTQRACAGVMERVDGKLDVAFCAFRPLLEYASMWTEEVEFPQARYHRLLETAVGTHAATLVPGSSGLRCVDEYDWANHRLFPGTRAQFLADLAAVAPEQHAIPLNPGQALTVRRGKHPLVEDSPYARTEELDEERIAFDPVGHPTPELRDPNPRHFPERAMRELIIHGVENTLLQELNRLLTHQLTGPLRTLWNRRACFQVDVVLPSETLSWHVDAWHPSLRLKRGVAPVADYTWRYVASEIFAAVQGIPLQPTVRAFRRRESLPGRLDTLDPARLHGLDVYGVVDETFEWNPLGVLAP